MAYYTLISKFFVCPQYKKKISISGKYYFTENPDNEYEVRFSHATCPIIKNSKLPKYEQSEEYKYLDCFNDNCPYQENFPLLWDSRNNLE